MYKVHVINFQWMIIHVYCLTIKHVKKHQFKLFNENVIYQINFCFWIQHDFNFLCIYFDYRSFVFNHAKFFSTTFDVFDFDKNRKKFIEIKIDFVIWYRIFLWINLIENHQIDYFFDFKSNVIFLKCILSFLFSHFLMLQSNLSNFKHRFFFDDFDFLFDLTIQFFKFD